MAKQGSSLFSCSRGGGIPSGSGGLSQRAAYRAQPGPGERPENFEAGNGWIPLVLFATVIIGGFFYAVRNW